MQENTPKQLFIYRDENGVEPFIQWLESIKDTVTRARIKNRVSRIELGNIGDCKSLGEGLFELRLHFSSGYRVYIGNDHGTVVVLLCGGSKHSQTKNIVLARKYWKRYKLITQRV